MKPIIATLLLPSMALAMLAGPAPNTTTVSTLPTPVPSAAADNTTNIIPRSITDPPPPGAACTDEGDWFCFTTTYQRCASGQWTAILPLSPGTECTPTGLSHNSSAQPPEFGVGASGSAPTASSESLVPITMTTTKVVVVSDGASSTTVTSTVVTAALTTQTGSSATASGTHAPKADASGGDRICGGALWGLFEVAVIMAAHFVL